MSRPAASDPSAAGRRTGAEPPAATRVTRPLHRLAAAIPLVMFATLAPAQTPASPFEPIAWLAGCWRADGGEPGSIEQWMPPAGGTMLGMARTVRGGRTAEFEFMRIVAEDGALVFVAQPSGRPPTRFPAARVGAAEAVFEQPGHDFPQRVIYAQDGADRLRARIEGQRGGQLRGIDFPMTRTPCDGGPPNPTR